MVPGELGETNLAFTGGVDKDREGKWPITLNSQLKRDDHAGRRGNADKFCPLEDLPQT